MKIKLLAILVEKILGVAKVNETQRADMCLPNFLFVFGVILFVAGISLGVAFVFVLSVGLAVAALACIVLGIAAVMSWKNQTIRVISDEEFVYTTFFGNSYKYAFRDITSIRQNQDSLTLFVGEKKVRIESMAILSERLVTLINNVFEEQKTSEE